MANDYDLIVIGSTTAATHAALTAARLNARVALITSPDRHGYGLSDSAIYHQALTHLGRVLQHVRQADQLGIHIPRTDSTPQPVPLIQWQEAMDWVNTVVGTCAEQNSPVRLAALGVDVISGEGEFCRLPHLGFVVNNRRLRGRSYVIATGSCPQVPDIDGLETVGYVTPRDLWGQGENLGEESPLIASTPEFPKRWLVIGGSPRSVELAQILARLDCQVILVVSEPYILSLEDLDASRLVQAQLEAEGIRILTQSPVTQVRQIEGKKWVQAGDRAIEADEILLAIDEQPNIQSLNLEGVGVQWSQQGMKLNDYRQTTHPRIYACGYGKGYIIQSHLAEYEARRVVKNALFFPLFKVNDQGIPRITLTDPEVAQVGLTEAQARRRYGEGVCLAQHFFKTLDKAQILGETTGFCKLILRQNGEILGATVVGVAASEIIGAIALLMGNQIKANTLANVPYPSPTLAEILHHTGVAWQQQRFHRHRVLQNILEGFFNLRRSWSD